MKRFGIWFTIALFLIGSSAIAEDETGIRHNVARVLSHPGLVRKNEDGRTRTHFRLYYSVLIARLIVAYDQKDRDTLLEVRAITDRLLTQTLPPEDEGRAWSVRGVAFLFLEQYPEALQCYTRAIEIDPRPGYRAKYYEERAWAYERLGDAAAAARDREKARQVRRALAEEERRKRGR